MTCEKAAISSMFDFENCTVKIAARQGIVVPKEVDASHARPALDRDSNGRKCWDHFDLQITICS